MVNGVINPRFKVKFDVRKIHYHAAMIEGVSGQNKLSNNVVSMQVFAFAFVVDKAVTIAKKDLFRYSIHARICIMISAR